MIVFDHLWKFHVVLTNPPKNPFAISSIPLENTYPQPTFSVGSPYCGEGSGESPSTSQTFSPPLNLEISTHQIYIPSPPKINCRPLFDTQVILILILIDVQLLVFTECCFQSKLLLLLRFSPPGKPPPHPQQNLQFPQTGAKFTPNPYCYLENPAVLFCGIAHCPPSLCKISRKLLEQISTELKSYKISLPHQPHTNNTSEV